MTTMTLRRAGATACAALLTAAGAAGLAACGSSTTTGSGSTSTTTSASGGAKLTISDAWVKANTDIKAKNMTGIFGKIANAGDKTATIVSGTNSASPVTELHETVMKNGAMVMQPVKDGFTIEAGKTLELKPGSNHIMVMKMTKPLRAGESVKVALKTKDGGTLEFTAVAKVFTMGNEPYQSATHS